MVEKTPKRVISKKTVRNLLKLSHCEFRNRLIYYATTKHRRVVIVSEAYTTKTCGNCGCIKEVGAAKVFSCKCGYTMDRDSSHRSTDKEFGDPLFVIKNNGVLVPTP